MGVREELQDSISMYDDYILKTDNALIDKISEFGMGETEFHTGDIERLIRENREMKRAIKAVMKCDAFDPIRKGYPDIAKHLKDSVPMDYTPCGKCGKPIHVDDLQSISKEGGLRHANCNKIKSPKS